MIDHEFRPYADFPHLCVAEVTDGDTCNHPIEEHLSTEALLERYRNENDDEEMEVLQELHDRAMSGDVAAREVLNDYDKGDPGWTPSTGSESKP